MQVEAQHQSQYQHRCLMMLVLTLRMAALWACLVAMMTLDYY
jgi:hypothetical protein